MRSQRIRTLVVILTLGWTLPSAAAILPEDRADALYHSYEGGGVKVDGPSILVRKQIGKNFSVSANYYVDSVSSASIDVVTTASPYSEERTQKSVGVDYLRGKTTMSFSFTNSEENDYSADSYNFAVSQDIFGGLTTVTLGYGLNSDTVGSNVDSTFTEDIDRQAYRIAISQVITKNMLMGVNFETITDEGYLNNPYRSVRYLDTGNANGYSYEQEMYPNTRTSTAVSVRANYYLPYRAALHGEYRFFTDTWGIDAHTGEIGYTHPLDFGLTLSLKYRYYTQNKADFYSDLFPRVQAQNFLARDKELSTFDSHDVRVGASYDFVKKGWGPISRGSINLSYDFMRFEYDDFRDLTVSATPGTEPLYDLDANVIQAYVSFWY